MEKGGISVNTENLLPIIKKWLYSDKDIFLREIVSNACDAVTKHKRLTGLGEAAPEENGYRIDVVLDKENNTLSVQDNGVGMTTDEVRRYIGQIALSGALDFVEKYETSEDAGQIIGHFGLGFYSSFMVSSLVEIETLSYQEGSEPVWWASDGGSEYDLDTGHRETRGTRVVMHIDEAEKEFLDEARVRGILEKYCSFMPVEIFFSLQGAEPEKDADGKPLEAKPVNTTRPLWNKNARECTDEEYNALYRKLFNDFRDPLFTVHISADYPLNFKGIFFFPPLGKEYESLEPQVKLFYNQVFVSDNIKEIVPEAMLMLRGVVDCPELPLNVSRSFLQGSDYVKKLSQHIGRKIGDKIVSLFESEREKYEGLWKDLRVFAEYACLRDKKLFERFGKTALFEKLDGGFVTLEEYRAAAPEAYKHTVYYVNDKTQQSQHARMYTAQGIGVVVLDRTLDTQFAQFLEMEHHEDKLKFQRVDADLGEAVRGGEVSEHEAQTAKELFKKAAGERVGEIRADALKDENVAAMVTVSEHSRRMQDLAAMYGEKIPGMSFPEERSLVVNLSCGLVQKLCALAATEPDSEKALLCARHVVDLAFLCQKPLNEEETAKFVRRNLEIMNLLV